MKAVVRLIVFFTSINLCAQTAPSAETLTLSLRTIAKAVAGCRDVFARKASGTSTPILKLVLSPENYAKDMETLDSVEKLTSAMSSQPDRITGRRLVSVLSTMDDLSVGAGSSRFEVISAAILKKSPRPSDQELFAMSEGLNSCQQNLFNAGDDYVALVLNYIGAQDQALAARNSKR